LTYFRLCSKLIKEIGCKETIDLLLFFISKLVRGYLFNNFFKLPNGDLVEINCLGNSMYVSTKDAGLSQELLTYGIHEPFLTLLLANEIRDTDVLVGVGSNIGYYVLLYGSMLEDKGKIIAIEPDPRSFRILRLNTALNSYDNRVKLVNVAVGSGNGTAYISLNKSFNLSSITTLSEKKFNEKTRFETNLVSLDDILSNESKIDIIRMDIEGYEFEVIKGMIKTLKNLKPRILAIELHPIEDCELMDSFFKTLESLNYEIKWAIPRHLIDGMLEVPAPLLQGALALVKGEIPRNNRSLSPDQIIEIKTFAKKFCSSKDVYHIIFSKNL
jgi:FkbM family methyltransferase